MRFLIVVLFVSLVMFLLRKEKFEYKEHHDEKLEVCDFDEKE